MGYVYDYFVKMCYVTWLQGPPICLFSNVTKKRYKVLQKHVCVKFGVLQTSLQRFFGYITLLSVCNMLTYKIYSLQNTLNSSKDFLLLK